MHFLITLLASFFCFSPLSAEPLCGENGDLFRDLMMVDLINRAISDRMPVTYNNTLQGGYIQMPSARMGDEGELAGGVSWVPPYRNYNIRAQILPHIEITGSYRVFNGIQDSVLSPHGFGDFSDKGANIKFAIVRPEDSDYLLPGIALGLDDFLGTRSFKAQYAVATQVFLKYNFEFSLGYGTERINKWFGGIIWMPWRQNECSYLRDIALTAEYDAIDYRSKQHEPHPDGREVKSRINTGVKWRLWNFLDLSLSYVRGLHVAGSASLFYNFGESNGFIPKYNDPLPYTSPTITESIGCLRSEEALAQDLLWALRDQGFMLLHAALTYNPSCEKVLYLKVYNCTWTFERIVRSRLNHILANLKPQDIDAVIVVMESEGFPIQQYYYRAPFLEMYEEHSSCDFELDLLTPMCEASSPDPCRTRLLYENDRCIVDWDLLPKINTYFGSATGKFKYAGGLNFGAHGIIPTGNVYYRVLFGYTAFTKISDLTGVDILNPSQLINVNTDIVLYLKNKGLTLDEAWFQKTLNLGCGFYWRAAGGYFSQPYFGAGMEFLWYPANSNFAVGIDGAVVRKRKTHGILLSSKIRKFKGFVPEEVRFTGSQFFLDLYYDCRPIEMDLKVSIGKFLANDYGARYEVGRYFWNGLRLFMWYTGTNAGDKVNGETYHDKGVGISMPLDVFYTYSSREKWQYSISAWLRDCGYRTYTGDGLYEMIHDQRIR